MYPAAIEKEVAAGHQGNFDVTFNLNIKEKLSCLHLAMALVESRRNLSSFFMLCFYMSCFSHLGFYCVKLMPFCTNRIYTRFSAFNGCLESDSLVFLRKSSTKILPPDFLEPMALVVEQRDNTKSCTKTELLCMNCFVWCRR